MKIINFYKINDAHSLVVLVGVELAVAAGQRVARVAEEGQRLPLVHGAVHDALPLLRLAAACGERGVTSPRRHRDVTATQRDPLVEEATPWDGHGRCGGTSR